ncbi:PTS sugar transporter subunit IIC [Thermoanaerobacter wiegelii]|uniref:Permease IIC component n=1 Tax=Thermoanaerobacter wiegelii Rt8.B1 TaxID=697303 RepID=G2MUV4_9THEO|nr:PTS sugar transporter subunit IIC [Thermoanaerobacter wiegelii]AEM77855.1 PTS system, lactose/cellobiose family IIC subunit [Thermoanaerobacter wiegelii Rt8.B1]
MLGKVTSFVEKWVVPIFEPIGRERHMVAVRDGFVGAMPFFIVGSFFILFANPPVQSWADAIAPYKDLIMTPFRMTMGIMSIYVCFALAYSLSKSYDLNPLSGGLVAIMTFLLVAAPITRVDLANGAQGLFVPTDYLGSAGLFTAMLVGIVAVEIFRSMVKRGATIKMPEGVPPVIAAAFESLPTIAVLIIIFYPLNLAIKYATGQPIPGIIMKLFEPLVAVSDSIGAVFLSSTLAQLLWSVGIHGGSIVLGILKPFMMPLIDQNAAAWAAGEPMKHIFVYPFYSFYLSIGGCGATLGLAIMLLRAKSAHLRNIGKVALIPAIFNINEPLIFGVPLMLNPVMFIPFVFAQGIIGVLAYIAHLLGWVRPMFIIPPWTAPAPVGAFLATGGDWRSIILVIVLTVIATLIYWPFLKVYDKQMFEQEQKAAQKDAQ